MPDLDDVLSQLQGEEIGEINWNAPDPGAFRPPLDPQQNVEFKFYLPGEFPSSVNNHPDAFTTVEIKGKKYLQVNFGALITFTKADGSVGEKMVAFQRASTYKTDKMENSNVGDLIRSLGLHAEYRQAFDETGDVNKAITLILSAASGRAIGHADVGWGAFFKDAKTSYKTSQGKKVVNDKGYVTLPWPRGADGKYVASVSDPGTGEEKYGNLELVRFRLPKPAPVTV